MEERETLLPLSYAEALRIAGEEERARNEGQEHKSRLLEQAARIRNPETRTRFLYRAPDNRRVLELVEALGG